ncbi:MAG: chorismate synthase, partial [Candidatus Bipolaricaulota bacterium]
SLVGIVEGVPAGIALSEADIQPDLDRRKPGQSEIATPRKESDAVRILSGTMDGMTTGAPVAMVIDNEWATPERIAAYAPEKELAKPGHATYGYRAKFGPHRDWIADGRANGRETAMRVAAGAIARKLLRVEGIEIVGYTQALGGVECSPMRFEDVQSQAETSIVRCPDPAIAQRMLARAVEVKARGDSIGGVVCVMARGVPAGWGEPVFGKLDADLARAMMSIGAVKGVEVGAGLSAASMLGSENNDVPFVDRGVVRFRTNHAGGIVGGISTGADIVVRLAVKPTPTIAAEQDTIDMKSMTAAKFRCKTATDPTIVPRLVPIAEAMMALTLADHAMLAKAQSHRKES